MAEDTNKPNDILELAPETRLPEDEEEKSGFFGKLKRGLFMTHTEIIDKVSDAMKNKVTLDDRTLEYLEETLIGADMGVETSLELVERHPALVGRARESLNEAVDQLKRELFGE